MGHPLEKKLAEFLAASRRNAWIESDEIEVYLRKGPRGFRLPDQTIKVLPTLDIASIVVNEGYHRQGYFKGFLALAETIPGDFEALYVENCLNVLVSDYLEKQAGWHAVPTIPVSFYKILSRS